MRSLQCCSTAALLHFTPSSSAAGGLLTRSSNASQRHWKSDRTACDLPCDLLAPFGFGLATIIAILTKPSAPMFAEWLGWGFVCILLALPIAETYAAPVLTLTVDGLAVRHRLIFRGATIQEVSWCQIAGFRRIGRLNHRVVIDIQGQYLPLELPIVLVVRPKQTIRLLRRWREMALSRNPPQIEPRNRSAPRSPSRGKSLLDYAPPSWRQSWRHAGRRPAMDQRDTL
jgi:hypothetical protein